MIIPEIKDYHSPDVADLEHYRPPRTGEVLVGVQMSIGPRDAKTSDLFQVVLLGPGSIEKYAQGAPCVDGRHTLLVTRWDWAAIKSHLESLATQCSAVTWPEAAQKLARHFHWEYEDYKMEGSSVGAR